MAHHTPRARLCPPHPAPVPTTHPAPVPTTHPAPVPTQVYDTVKSRPDVAFEAQLAAVYCHMKLWSDDHLQHAMR